MEPRISVRRAHVSDLDRILAIEKSGFGQWAWDRNLFAEYAQNCADLFLVAHAAGGVIGYSITCVSRRAGLERAELVSIAVAPAARGKGAADALMSRTLRHLRRQGIPRIGLTVKVTNERAQAFYERYGFRRVRRVPSYYEDGSDAFAFRLDL